MANLFDALNSLRSSTSLTAQGGQQGQLQQAALATSGKALTSTGPAASDLGEQQAQATTQTQQQQLQAQTNANVQNQTTQAQQSQQAAAQTGATQKQELSQSLQNTSQNLAAGTAQNQQNYTLGLQKVQSEGLTQRDAISAKANQALTNLAAEHESTVDNIFRSFKQSNLDLSQRRDAAELEQTAFLYSMKDKAYTQTLTQIGQARNLNDQQNFAREAGDITFGTTLDQTMQKIGLAQYLGQNERDLKDAISRIDIKQAIDLANATAQSEATKMLVSGTTTAVKYSADLYDKNNPQPTASPTTEGP